MDSLTQIVLGAAVGEAVLGKKIGNKALFYGAIGGTIPDLDVLIGNFTDTITAIELHRGFSHSIVFCVLMAPVLGWLVNSIERKHNLGWQPWAKLFFWCLFTHPLLDAFTTWGTQLFWPFKTKLAFNTIFVIDPLYTLPFLTCCIGLMFCKRNSKLRKRLNTIGLTLSTNYLLVALVLKFVAHEKIEDELNKQGIAYTAISTRPAPLNTVLWNANIDTDDNYLITDYSFFDSQPLTFKKYPKNRQLSIAITKHLNVQRLITISEGWYIIEQKKEQWYFNDLRFGLIPKKDGTSFFTFSYLLKEKDDNIYATEVPKTKRDARFLIAKLWKRIKGN
ncbi:metal-dependent hydrolase [Seonamhaeicola algicola]|uniref:Metal-dependent hydrolase n=1 Tax=Seonamhaeicola algicola TaxID=1719036 RepID=A0A5C7AVB0_9FLAO|nr:metal-dependent hydrolase [Seonamhaeicola algicola]TXE11593.1 metal-dependent hydrolase [Seonamhaeicola algicola]